MGRFNIISFITRTVRKVVMLRTRAFPPEPRGLKEGKTLVKGGYDVHVIAWDRLSEFPKREVIDGVSIRRVHIPSTYNDFMKFLVTLPLFWFFSLFSVLKRKPDVVHCADLDTMPVGLIAKKLIQCKLVFDAYEKYPEMVRDSISEAMFRFLDRVDKRCAKMADLVIVVWSSVLDRYPQSVEVPNLPEGREFDKVTPEDRNRKRRELGIEDKFVIGYVGILMRGRGIEQVIQAVRGDPDAFFLIGGFGQEEDTIKNLTSQVKETMFIGFVKPQNVPSIICACDAVVEILDPSNSNYRAAAGNKLFDALNAGLPFITAKGTVQGEFVQSLECGVAVEYGNVEELKKVIASLAKDRAIARSLGERGKQAARERWNWEMTEGILSEAYARLDNGK